VERTRVHHRFTHVAQANLVATAVLDCECNAGCERNMAAHDSMSAKEVDLLVEQVHGATLAAHYSILAAEQLGHDTARAHAPCESRTVIAVGGDHVVVRPQHCKRAGGYSFLPVIQVAETTDLAQCVRLGRALLEATLQKHGTQKLQVRFAIVVLCRTRSSLAHCTSPGLARRARCGLGSAGLLRGLRRARP